MMKLVMMVKNEAPTIAKTIESALPYITSALIVDTGSTDGTVGIAAKVFERDRVNVRFESHPWTGCFDVNRNAVLEEAWKFHDGALLLLDGEEILEGDPLKGEGNVALTIHNGEGWVWPQIRVLRDRKARYIGATHEYLSVVAKTWSRTKVSSRQGFASNQEEKWGRDLKLLDDSPRGRFYRGLTLDWLGRKEEAAHWFRRTLYSGIWYPCIYESLMRLGRYEDACRYQRAEPWLEEAKGAERCGDWSSVVRFATNALDCRRPDQGYLFLYEPAYDYEAHNLLAFALYKQGKYAEALPYAEHADKAHRSAVTGSLVREIVSASKFTGLR